MTDVAPPAIHLLAALVLLVACSSSSAADPSGTAGASGSSATAPCAKQPSGWPDPPPNDSTCVAGASGRVVGDDGAPLANALVSVCGFACFGGKTSADGTFRVAVGANLAWNGFSFLVHGRPDHAELVIPLPAYSLEMALGDLRVPTLPPGTSSLPDDGGPGGAVTAGPLTLTVPAGTAWDLTFADVATGAEGRKLRAVRVPVDGAPPFASGAVVVLALAPSSAKPSVKVAVSIADAGGLPAGAAVDFVVLEDDYLQTPNLAGTGKVVATGHVSADGTSVATDAGEGIDRLTWVAVRKK